MRECFPRKRRSEAFEASLGITRHVLADRLKKLVLRRAAPDPVSGITQTLRERRTPVAVTYSWRLTAAYGRKLSVAMVDKETNQQTRRTSNPPYLALTAPPLQSYNAGCEANNDGIFLSVFQFWSTFPNSMTRPESGSISSRSTRGIAVNQHRDDLCVGDFELAGNGCNA